MSNLSRDDIKGIVREDALRRIARYERDIEKTSKDMQEVFEKMWELLDAVSDQARDSIWYDGTTTAHERLIELAEIYCPAEARKMREATE